LPTNASLLIKCRGLIRLEPTPFITYKIIHPNQQVELLLEMGQHPTCIFTNERVNFFAEPTGVYLPLIIK
jgi:hypothetical protein